MMLTGDLLEPLAGLKLGHLIPSVFWIENFMLN